MRIQRTKITAFVMALMVSMVMVTTGGRLFADDSEGTKVYYKDGLNIESADGNNSLHLNGRLQSRFTYVSTEAAPDTDTFSIPRGEIRMEGHVFNKVLTYGFEMGFGTRVGSKTTPVCADAGCTKTVNAVTTESTTGLPVLNDYYLDYLPIDEVGVKFGQFKVPYLYTELSSAMKQEFPDRNLNHNTFTFARDLGVNIHGNVLDYHLGYNVFFMNGDGANTINANQGLMVGARLEIPIFGNYKYSESDVEYSEEPALGLGLAYLFDERGSAFENGTIPANAKASHGTMDLNFRSHGFFALGQGEISRSQEGTRLTNWGYNAQVGYFLIPKHLELAARTGGVIFSDAIANQYEHGAVLGYYFNKHNLKIQTDYALIMNARGLNLNDQQVRTQLTVVF